MLPYLLFAMYLPVFQASMREGRTTHFRKSGRVKQCRAMRIAVKTASELWMVGAARGSRRPTCVSTSMYPGLSFDEQHSAFSTPVGIWGTDVLCVWYWVLCGRNWFSDIRNNTMTINHIIHGQLNICLIIHS